VRKTQLFLLEDYERYVVLTRSGLFFVAHSHQGQDLQHEAVVALSDAIESCTCHGGLQHPLSVRYFVTMEDWACVWSSVDLLATAHVRRMDALAELTGNAYPTKLSD
jgi:hypothetical protein